MWRVTTVHGTHAPGDGLSNMDNDLRIAVDLRFLALEQNGNLKTQKENMQTGHR